MNYPPADWIDPYGFPLPADLPPAAFLEEDWRADMAAWLRTCGEFHKGLNINTGVTEDHCTLTCTILPGNFQHPQHGHRVSTVNHVALPWDLSNNGAFQDARAMYGAPWFHGDAAATMSLMGDHIMSEGNSIRLGDLDKENSSEGSPAGAFMTRGASVAQGNECLCMVCTGLGDRTTDHFANAELASLCRFPGCGWYPITLTTLFRDRNIESAAELFKHHERRHCAQINDAFWKGSGINRTGVIRRGEMHHFFCPQPDCAFTTKRWSDLERHTVTKHCMNKRRFPCPVFECKYHGEGKGFIRKDKLQSHFRTVHEGKARPGKANRVIKPKVAVKPKVPSS